MNITFLTQLPHSITAMRFLEDFHAHNIDVQPLDPIPEWIVIDDYLLTPKIKIIGGELLSNRVIRYSIYDNFNYRELWK